MRLTAEQMAFLAQTDSCSVVKKATGGFRVRDFPITVESPNCSLHVAPSGEVETGHNQEEVERILSQIKREINFALRGDQIDSAESDCTVSLQNRITSAYQLAHTLRREFWPFCRKQAIADRISQALEPNMK